MDDIASADLLADDSIEAGLRALEALHARHLDGMSGEEQEAARAHWRDQVERILGAVYSHVTGTSVDDEHGRAVLAFVDNDEGGIDVSAAFRPQLRELEDGELDGTPAQVVAIVSLQALEDSDEEDED
jgi:hypothetical protein